MAVTVEVAVSKRKNQNEIGPAVFFDDDIAEQSHTDSTKMHPRDRRMLEDYDGIL